MFAPVCRCLLRTDEELQVNLQELDFKDCDQHQLEEGKCRHPLIMFFTYSPLITICMHVSNYVNPKDYPSFPYLPCYLGFMMGSNAMLSNFSCSINTTWWWYINDDLMNMEVCFNVELSDSGTWYGMVVMVSLACGLWFVLGSAF